VALSHEELTKIATLITGNRYLQMEYEMEGDLYIKHGLTTDLMDIIWNGKGNIQRMWGDYGSYCGRRNSSSGATAAIVLGSAGGSHNLSFEGTLVQGDEIYADGSFNCYLYAGVTSDPYDYNENKVWELDDLAVQLGDEIPPAVVQAAAHKLNNILVQIVISEPVTPASAGNLANYQLSGDLAGYEIAQARLTHANRRIVLRFANALPANPQGSITLSNIEDFSGNTISEEADTAVLTAYIIPHLVGTMNNWNPANHNYELVCHDNMLWALTLSLSAGIHQYKVIESDSWNGNDWPITNQIISLSALETITIWVNCGLFPNSNDWEGYVCHSTNPPIICGDFLSELGGSDWDENSPLTIMNDEGENGDEIAGDGIFSRILLMPEGNWEFKIVLNNNWDQNTSEDNLYINLPEQTNIRFTYNFIDNGITWQNGEQYTGYGDIDNNGYVESFDAALVLQYFVGLDPSAAPLPWEEWRLVRADVDGNGFVEAYDASLIQRFVVGMIDHFPVEDNR
jgi:hypothetical protein